MRTKTRSSITLSAQDLKILVALRAKLNVKSEANAVRRSLRVAYRRASRATRGSLGREMAELDQLASEGLDES
jgi:hypothetical protein